NRSGCESGAGKVDRPQGSQSARPSAPTSDKVCFCPGGKPVARNCQNWPAMSVIRPATLVLPTRKVGAAPSGSANDALISIALSLTVGSRWRNAPALQVEEAG